MFETSFNPVVYVRTGCPFCLKLRLFLLEARLLDRVTLREGQTPKEHRQLADHLTEKLGKTSFPAAEIAPNEYLGDSNTLVTHFARESGVGFDGLPTRPILAA